MKAAKAPRVKYPGPVTLKAVAEHVGLTPGTVSAVLNNSAAARSIPEHTRKRILEAARALNYRPNFLARSLRVQRTYTVGVIAEEIGDAYGGLVVSGIEAYLRDRGTEHPFRRRRPTDVAHADEQHRARWIKRHATNDSPTSTLRPCR